MVKNIVCCFIVFLLYSCALDLQKKNEYGKPRFKKYRFSLNANLGEESKIKHLISLDSIYKLVKVIYKEYDKEEYKELINFRKRYLKFYENGKLAIFEEEMLHEMNPKKSIMGIYEYKNNKLYIEYFSYSVQADYFKTKQELYIQNNKLIETDKYYRHIYEKMYLPSKNDIRPDW